MMKGQCPGAKNLRTPEIEVKTCPCCAGPIELFSDEKETKCPSCGHVVYRDITSCAKWCRFAEECLGEEKVRSLRGK